MALKCLGQRLFLGLTQTTHSLFINQAIYTKGNALALAPCFLTNKLGCFNVFMVGHYSSQLQASGSDFSDDTLYPLVSVKVKGSDEAVLKSYTHFVTRAANILNIDISKTILLPTRKERYTLLKSPHIYKKHRAQYEIRTHSRLLQLRNITAETSDVFLEYIQRNLPEGISMNIEHTALKQMPDYLQPPPEALEFLKMQRKDSENIPETG
ncbi:28S ribosomal protein S10, mitochondrial-like [Actinia tenebrosa]|uniref:Small ribosomal subunit protein uS10m n=1 Tax=Actinia tenebrosa TaxID=6105 RepID=A0A6P8HYV9_ACTTE|nr:28S ribosomal protein S10, mitochondrial-like [Actinia tenebrosa]